MCEGQFVRDALKRIETKLDDHLEESVTLQATVAVTKSTVSTHSKLFWAGGGILATLLVETGVGFIVLVGQHFSG